MSVVISDELQELFDLRDHRSTAIEKFIMAEAELQGNMQQNANKEFVEIHDLDVTHKLLKPVLETKDELEMINAKFEAKKKFFISLLESSGCPKLHCTNKEFNEHGHFEYIPYTISVAKNINGDMDLLILHKTSVHKAS